MQDGGNRSVKHADGLVNVLSNLGTPYDKATHTQVVSDVPLTEFELTSIYQDSSYAARICDELPKDCVKAGVTIKLVKPKKSLDADPFKVPFQQLGVMQALAQAHTWARLFGGGAIILGLADAGSNASPAKPGKLIRLLPVSRFELQPDSWVKDWTDEQWGKPEVYKCTVRRGGIEAPPLIHHTRVVRFEGVPRPPGSHGEAEDSWGDSELRRSWKPVQNLTVAEAGMANAVHDLNVMVMAIRGLSEIAISESGTEELMKRMLAVQLSKSVCNTVLIDADEEKAEYLTRDIKGFSEVHDRFRLSVGAAAGIPHTRLFGDAPSGFSTDDKSGQQNWATRVAAVQKDVYEGPVRRIVDVMMVDPQGPTRGKVYDYEVVWPPFQEPSAQEAADQEHIEAQSDALYIRSGVLTDKDVWNRRNAKWRLEKEGKFLSDMPQGGGEWQGQNLSPPTPGNPQGLGNKPQPGKGLNSQLSQSEGNTTGESSPVPVK